MGAENQFFGHCLVSLDPCLIKNDIKLLNQKHLNIFLALPSYKMYFLYFMPSLSGYWGLFGGLLVLNQQITTRLALLIKTELLKTNVLANNILK